MHTGFGGQVGVAAATALGVTCLAGAPLYVSSSASAAVQTELGRTCLGDLGLQVSARQRTDVIHAAEALPHSAAPIRTVDTFLSPAAMRRSDGTVQRGVVISREGQEGELGIESLGPGEAAFPEWAGGQGGVAIGDQFTIHIDPEDYTDATGAVVAAADSIDVPLTIAAFYPAIPVYPEPAFWCDLRRALRPSAFGDQPPPLILVAPETLDAVPDFARDERLDFRPDPRHLSQHDVEVLYQRQRDVAQRVVNISERNLDSGQFGAAGQPPAITVDDIVGDGLPTLLNRARIASDVVARTVAPIRLAGMAAAGLLLVAAGTLLGRTARGELRLRVLRGAHPATVGARVAGRTVPAVALGAAAGLGIAIVAMKTFAPNPELDPGPLRAAAVATAAGAVGALAVLGAVIAVGAGAAVDVGRSHHRRIPIPWELLVVALAVASYLRLDRLGGVRLAGSTVTGGDLLAQAFPILALAAVLALLVRPLRWLLGQTRRLGARWPVTVLVATRRLAAERTTSVVMALTAGLVLGAVTLASTLTDSSEQLLRDKAATYLGADAVMSTPDHVELPAGLSGTIVVRQQARSDDQPIDLLGVDPARFPATGRWLDAASGASLSELMDRIADPAPGTLPVIVVNGELPTGTIDLLPQGEFEVQPVATARWFPGYHNGAIMVVADREALALATDDVLVREIWLRDPPPDAADTIRAAGYRVRATQATADVFDVTSFLTVRWSYRVFTAFGVLVGVVLIAAQLLVLDARRRSRQAATVLGRRMGFGRRHDAGALLVELAVPYVVGAIVGVVTAIGIVHLSVRKFDTLRNLQPPARVIVDVPAVVGFALAGAVVIVGLALIGSAMGTRIRTMEAMRSAA